VRYLGLACDYDGTLASWGTISGATLSALHRFRASNRKLIMVTGRGLDSLRESCPNLGLFDRVIAENGGLIYRPNEREEEPLCGPPDHRFAQALKARGVSPVFVGKTIVSTSMPHEKTVLETIRDLGLELHVIFNKGAVMVLPSGVNKASGLAAALRELHLSTHNVVGVGDAENDHAFLSACECGVSVANGLRVIKEHADVVTLGEDGDGVVELIDEMIEDDLLERTRFVRRHDIPIGKRDDGARVAIPPYGTRMLIAGPSGGGKTTATSGLLDRLAHEGYQFCVLDPEGDYSELQQAVSIGTVDAPPTFEEMMQLLRDPAQNVVLNLLRVSLHDRPKFLREMLVHIRKLHAETGRPHWLIVDEAHHFIPASANVSDGALEPLLETGVLITVHPRSIAPAVLSRMGWVVAIGEEPHRTIREAAELVRDPRGMDVRDGEGTLVWMRTSERSDVYRLRPELPAVERRRHHRKYAEGKLPPDRSFYFRGPDKRLNLPVRNLLQFVEIASGVDEETWMHHLEKDDYSSWMRSCIKDDDLADEVAAIERERDLSPRQSRERIRDAIERRYTLPEEGLDSSS
jgi:hydroxymethylpyrimidine pyrophosphatase-like HAD family hydrolase